MAIAFGLDLVDGRVRSVVAHDYGVDSAFDFGRLAHILGSLVVPFNAQDWLDTLHRDTLDLACRPFPRPTLNMRKF